jgi:hypothetical protein
VDFGEAHRRGREAPASRGGRRIFASHGSAFDDSKLFC